MLWQFRLTLAGPPAETQADLLFDRAGDLCVEVVPAEDAAWVAFDREAPTLIDAVVSGVRDLDVASLGVVAAVDDDPVVTVETVAERTGRPTAAVRDLLAPAGRTVLWPEAAARLGLPPASSGPTLRAVTLALELRSLTPHLERLAPIRALLL